MSTSSGDNGRHLHKFADLFLVLHFQQRHKHLACHTVIVTLCSTLEFVLEVCIRTGIPQEQQQKKIDSHVDRSERWVMMFVREAPFQ